MGNNCIKVERDEPYPKEILAIEVSGEEKEDKKEKEEDKKEKQETSPLAKTHSDETVVAVRTESKLEIKEQTDEAILLALDVEQLVDVPHKGEYVKARVTSVYDGDTCNVVYLLNKDPFFTHVRMLGIDCPEMKGKGVTALEKRAAVCARRYLVEQVENKIVWMHIVKNDKFGGRILAQLYPSDLCKEDLPETESINEKMVKLKLGKAYKGDKKKPWMMKELMYIINNFEKV